MIFFIFDRVAVKTENSFIHEPRKRQIPKLSRANCVIIQLTVGTWSDEPGLPGLSGRLALPR